MTRHFLLCLLCIVSTSLIVGISADRPATKLRGTNNVSSDNVNFCFQAELLQEKYKQCSDDDCRSLYRSVIQGVIEQAKTAGQKCDIVRENEQVCPKLERYVQQYSTVLNSSPQDLWFLIEKINSLKLQTSQKGTICSVEIPNFDLCAQVKEDIDSISSECSDNTICKAYYKKRAETILSQFTKHNRKCSVKIPEIDDHYDQEIDEEQAEGMEIVHPINTIKASLCKRAENELKNYAHCEDLDCQLNSLEEIKGSIQNAEDHGEICDIEVPQINFCAKAAPLLRSFHQCGENAICKTQYQGLLQEILEYAERDGQECDIKVPMIKPASRLNSSTGIKISNLNENIDTEERMNRDKTGDLKVGYGYSLSVEL